MKKPAVLLYLSLVISSTITAQSDVNTQVMQDVFHDFSANSGGRTFTGAEFHVKEATEGSSYLFDKWVKGIVTTGNGALVNGPSYLFNFNKMTGSLLVTRDQKTYIEVDNNTIKAFTLTSDRETAVTFERVPVIDKDHFFNLLTKGIKFSLYRLTRTRFQKANYHTDGIAETGRKYDEYIDENEYYIMLPGGKDYRKVSLKKKAIREALPGESAKVDNYFSEHKYNDINEDFLKGLIVDLNQ